VVVGPGSAPLAPASSASAATAASSRIRAARSVSCSPRPPVQQERRQSAVPTVPGSSARVRIDSAARAALRTREGDAIQPQRLATAAVSDCEKPRNGARVWWHAAAGGRARLAARAGTWESGGGRTRRPSCLVPAARSRARRAATHRRSALQSPIAAPARERALLVGAVPAPRKLLAPACGGCHDYRCALARSRV
jgi:hypothetical protein